MSNKDTKYTLKNEGNQLTLDNTRDPESNPSSAWYQAITLSERIASQHPIKKQLHDRKIDAEIAERRMQRWKSQHPFSTDSYFAQRLAIDGITEKEFLYQLGEPIEAVRDRYPSPQKSLTEIISAFSRPVSSNLPPLPKEQHNPEMSGFLDAIAPLIAQGCDRLREGIASLIETQSHLPFVPNTVEEALFANLPEKLLAMLSRTMVLELNIARLQGHLKGDTPAERFQSFGERLRQPNTALNLLQEYPVLARQLAMCIDQWVTFSLEFLHHLCSDWEAIRANFSAENAPGSLIALDSSVGDRHRGGRSVSIAKFTSGFQLVYKPYSFPRVFNLAKSAKRSSCIPNAEGSRSRDIRVG